MKRLIPALIVLIAVPAGSPSAQEAAANGLTMERALEIALENHPALTALRARIGMAEGEAVQAGLWPNPEIELGVEGYTPNADDRPRDLARLDNAAIVANRFLAAGGSGVSVDIPSIPEPDNPDQQQNVISLSQELPIWGAPRKARKAAAMDVARWRAEYRVEYLDTRARVKSAFQSVVYFQHVQEMMAELIDTFDEILAVSRARFDAGDIAEVEVLKAEANHERFVMDSQLAEKYLSDARAELNEAMGNPGVTVGACVGDLESSLPHVPDTLTAPLPMDHPLNLAFDLREERAAAEIAVEKAKRWPNPAVGVGYRDYEYTDQDTWDFSIGFEIPIFNRNQGNLRRARENLAREESIAHAERNRIETRRRAAVTAYTTHSRRVVTFRENIMPKMQRALDIARETYALGDIAILEVLDAYRSFSEARLSYLEELLDAHLAAVELERFGPGGLEAIGDEAREK